MANGTSKTAAEMLAEELERRVAGREIYPSCQVVFRPEDKRFREIITTDLAANRREMEAMCEMLLSRFRSYDMLCEQTEYVVRVRQSHLPETNGEATEPFGD